MVLEGLRSGDGPPSASEVLKRRMANIRRTLRRAEDSLEQAATAFEQLADDLETGSAPTLASLRRCSPHDRRPLPIASEFAMIGPRTVTFTVYGVEFRAELNGVQTDLIRLLAMTTKQGDKDLVGFKTTASLVHALRSRGFGATRRSVTVEVSRLRAALGAMNRDLIENRKRAGYRFRLRVATSVA